MRLMGRETRPLRSVVSRCGPLNAPHTTFAVSLSSWVISGALFSPLSPRPPLVAREWTASDCTARVVRERTVACSFLAFHHQETPSPIHLPSLANDTPPNPSLLPVRRIPSGAHKERKLAPTCQCSLSRPCSAAIVNLYSAFSHPVGPPPNRILI
jgi:hypothetical protein